MQSQEYLSFSDVGSIITSVGSDRTVLVQGENGIGKTSLFWYLKQQEQFKNHIAVDPIDCTQLSDGSVWMPDIDREAGVSRELPNERFGLNARNQRGIDGSRPSLICLDEVLKAPQYIKNVLAPIVYERRVGNYHMVEGSVVFGCTNLALEGLGDSLQAHLRNRLIIVKMRKPTADEWLAWASEKGIHPVVLAFVKMFDKVMHSFVDYDAGGKYHRDGINLAEANPYIFNPRAQQDGYASPRSLHAASDVVKNADRMSPIALEAALAGTVGAVTAAEMSAFVRFNREIPTFERVVAEPTKTPIVDNPTAQIVQVYQFVSRTEKREEAVAVVKYAARMKSEMQSMLCTVVANCPRVALFCQVQDFTDMLRKHNIYL